MRIQREIIKYLIAVSIVLFCSCGGKQESDILATAEMLIETSPDSALSIIKTIDTLSLHNKGQRAKYDLLNSMALYKNFIDTTDSNVIENAVKYYKHKGTDLDKAKTYLSLGRIQFNSGEYSKAIVSFLDADEYAKNVSDHKIKGDICEAIVNTYCITYNDILGTPYAKRAVDEYEVYGKHDLLYISKYRLAKNYSNTRMWDKADSIYCELIKDDSIARNLHSMACASYGLMLTYKPDSDPYKAVDLFNRAANSGYSMNNNEIGGYALSLAKTGDSDFAEQVLDILANKSEKNEWDYEYWSANVKNEEGKFQQAFNSLKASIDLQNSIVRKLFTESVVKAQSDRSNLQLETAAIKVKSHLLISIVSVIISFLTCIIIFLIFKIRQSRLALKIDTANKAFLDSKKDIEVILKKLQDSFEQYDSLQEKYLKIHKQKLSYLGPLYKLLRASGANESPEAQRMVYDGIVKMVAGINGDKTGQREFEKQIDTEFGGLMSSFREDFPGWKERDYRLVSCIFAGFKTDLLSLTLGIPSYASVYTKKSALKNLIEKSTVSGKDKYLSFF